MRKKVDMKRLAVIRQKAAVKGSYAAYFKSKKILIDFIEQYKTNKVFYDLLQHYKEVNEEGLFFKKETEIVDLTE